MLPIRLTLPLSEHGRLKDGFRLERGPTLDALLEASDARVRLERLEESRLSSPEAIVKALSVAEAYQCAWRRFHRAVQGSDLTMTPPTRIWSGFAWRTSPSLEGERWRREGTHKLLSHCMAVEGAMVAWTVCELRFGLAYHGIDADRNFVLAIRALGSDSYTHERLYSGTPFYVRAGVAECRPACRRAMLALLACMAHRSSGGGGGGERARWAAERASDALHHVRTAGDHAHSTFARFCWTMRQVAWGDMNLAYADILLQRVVTDEAMMVSSADEQALDILKLAARAAHLAVLYASIALRCKPLAVQTTSKDSKLVRDLGRDGNELRVAKECMRIASEAMDAYDIREPMVPATRRSLTMAVTLGRMVHFQEKVLKAMPFKDEGEPGLYAQAMYI